MGIFEDWFIGEILSFFAGEVEGTWHDAIEMNRRRKELEDSLRRMLEDEKEGQYWLHGQDLIQTQKRTTIKRRVSSCIRLLAIM